MSTLSIVELEEQIETDLGDTALQQIIDAVESDIEGHIGPSAGYMAVYRPELLTELRLPVKASAIVSATEYTGTLSDPTETALAADDYDLSADGWDLRRLSDGTNGRSVWGWQVDVVLTPVADVARRKQAAIQLARLEITHTGYASEKVGDWSVTMRDLKKERSRILARLDGAMIT